MPPSPSVALLQSQPAISPSRLLIIHLVFLKRLAGFCPQYRAQKLPPHPRPAMTHHAESGDGLSTSGDSTSAGDSTSSEDPPSSASSGSSASAGSAGGTTSPQHRIEDASAAPAGGTTPPYEYQSGKRPPPPLTTRCVIPRRTDWNFTAFGPRSCATGTLEAAASCTNQGGGRPPSPEQCSKRDAQTTSNKNQGDGGPPTSRSATPTPVGDTSPRPRGRVMETREAPVACGTRCATSKRGTIEGSKQRCFAH